MDTRFILEIDPPQRCLGTGEDDQPCPRFSEYAEVDSPSAVDSPRQLVIEPYCWQHLDMCILRWESNPTPQDIAREQFCITRFVVGYYGGTGTAEVCGSCPLESVPLPYEEASEADYADDAEKAVFRWSHGQDQAYSVTYRGEAGQERRVCAVWVADALVWDLYEFPREVCL